MRVGQLLVAFIGLLCALGLLYLLRYFILVIGLILGLFFCIGYFMGRK